MASIIRLFVEDEGGEGFVAQYDFNLADFAGQPPAPGDVIVPPMLPGGTDRLQVWDVVSRYFDPGRGFDASGCLRVRVRPRRATADELALLRPPPANAT